MRPDRVNPPKRSRTGAPLLVPATLAAALALAGCAIAPQSGTAPEPAPAAGSAARRQAPTLASERKWLQAWFADTPVRIGQPDADSLAVEVPLRFSFDPGLAVVKPPLAAVLDKLAQSLRRLPDAQLVSVAAPGDDARDPQLGRRRAEQVRAHLRRRGVRADRMAAAAATPAAAVQLQVAVAAP